MHSFPPADIFACALIASSVCSGAPDIFTSLAALHSNDFPLVMASLLGASVFIATIVLAAVIWTSQTYHPPGLSRSDSATMERTIRIDETALRRDCVVYIVATLLIAIVVSSGRIHLWQSIACLVFYALYIGIVIAYSRARDRRRTSASIMMMMEDEAYDSEMQPFESDLRVQKTSRWCPRLGNRTQQRSSRSQRQTVSVMQARDSIAEPLNSPWQQSRQMNSSLTDEQKEQQQPTHPSHLQLQQHAQPHSHSHSLHAVSPSPSSSDLLSAQPAIKLRPSVADSQLSHHTAISDTTLDALLQQLHYNTMQSNRPNQLEGLSWPVSQPLSDTSTTAYHTASTDATLFLESQSATSYRAKRTLSHFKTLVFICEWPLTLLRWLSIGRADGEWDERRRLVWCCVPVGATLLLTITFGGGWSAFATPLTASHDVPVIVVTLPAAALVSALIYYTTVPDVKPRYYPLLSFISFITSIAWLNLIASECVSLLQSLGIMLHLSSALLGLTVLAIGNSVGDLIADIQVARTGHTPTAIATCFGSPLVS